MITRLLGPKKWSYYYLLRRIMRHLQSATSWAAHGGRTGMNFVQMAGRLIRAELRLKHPASSLPPCFA